MNMNGYALSVRRGSPAGGPDIDFSQPESGTFAVLAGRTR